MCGIAGFYLPDREGDPGILRAMCDQLIHRGPDDDGYHIHGGCGIGMRRLSIIDLQTGHQPISNEDDSVWVVFNGEIYNHQELRRELTAQGHHFKTNSDTEVLVHLYEEQGTAGVERLRGMFAYAIWDTRQRLLFLVRDRFGKKPLYYAILPEGLYFASELKSLRQAGVPLHLDAEALKLYFQFSYIPDPWSPYQSVRKLPAGCWLRYDAQGREETGRYWRLPVPAERGEPELTEEAAGEQLRRLFDEAVRTRMIADVPLGAFLSGGIDSSSVVASMAQQSDEPVKTFSVGFEEDECNELPAAALVASRYHTDHHEILVRPDSVALVQRLVRHFDEPFGDSSAIPTYIVSEFAARHVKVALTGDGGDELFAGYPSFRRVTRLRKLDRLPLAIRRAIAGLGQILPYAAYGKNYLRMISRPSALDRYFELNYGPYFLRQQLLMPDWMLPGDASYLRSRLAQYLPDSDSDILTQALYFEATANLTGDMLVKVDRMSMANSLEVRCPMLDHKLAEFAFRLPNAWKLAGGRSKLVLLRAIGDRLPPELLRLPKKGFGVPLAAWFRGALREFLWDHLTSPTFLERGFVSPPFVRCLLEEHARGRRDNYHWLWRLLMLELWFREFHEAARL